MAAFLSAFSGKSKVYEVGLDGAGNVTVTTPALPAGFSSVDLLQLTDPVSGDSFNFSVFGGGLSLSNATWRQFPQKIKFSTRCFLIPSDLDNLASIELDVTLAAGQIVVTDFRIFGIQPLNGISAAGVAIGSMGNFEFYPQLKDIYNPNQVPFEYASPQVVTSLGIVVDPPSTATSPPGTIQPQLGCYPTSAGIRFQIVFPLKSGAGQALTPYGITFDAGHPAMSLTFTQDAASPDSNNPTFWILGVGIPSDIILNSWNANIAEPFLDSLNMVRSGMPISFVPTLTLGAGQAGFFDVTFALVDSTGRKKIQPTACVLLDPESALKSQCLNIVTRTIQIQSGQSIQCTATFGNIKSHTGDSVQVTCVLGATPDAVAADSGRVRPSLAGYCFGFQHKFDSFDTAVSQTPIRMGSLDLIFPAASISAAAGDLGRGFGSLRASRRFQDDSSRLLVRIDNLNFPLALKGLGIGGQDDLPGSEYAPPNQPYSHLSNQTNSYPATALQIPQDDFPSNGYYFILDVEETCYELVSQTLTLQIEQQHLSQAAGGGLRLVVFDPEPFLVAQVSVPDYEQSLRDAVTDQIATWDNSAADGGWKISAGTQAFQFILPPQGLTEAMHKNKDLPQPDITPGSAVDFRFTPPAVLGLTASSAVQRFVEAPWNLRRILGNPQQSVPGAVLKSATFELLYGLSASLNAKPGLMLAEIGARLGQYASAPNSSIPWRHTPAQELGFDAYSSYWTTLSPQLRTRLAAFEAWNPSQPEGLTLTEEDNLTFNLRPEADLAYPVENVTPPANIPNGKLRGSFAWAFDSERIYQSIWDNPQSVSSELSGLTFSALGGWGQFTARFANGKTSIIASVRMGRIQTLTIEQIGRIGNFWNRAKLVIVYERTVEASEQFADQQEPFTGNPILRKTAEYIQILEKRRDAASTDTVGVYTACEFPEGDPPKIPVDSAWGVNVGQYGYKIPLWRPGAQPTAVYVKPRVRLHLKAATSNSTVAHFIADPEKLCFYTNTASSASSDTDSWAKQLGVDFGYVTQALVAPTTPPSDVAAKAGGNVAGFQVPEEPWIQPGLGAFTYTLEQGALAANVTAGFSKTPIGSAMRTITVMRGLDKSAVMGAADAHYAASLQLPDLVTNILRPVLSQIPVGASAVQLASTWNDLKTKATQTATDCISQFNTFKDNFAAGVPNADKLCGVLQNQLSGQLTALNQQIENEVAGQLAAVRDLLVLPGPPPSLTNLQATWTALYASTQSQLRFTGSQVTWWASKLTAYVNQTFGTLATTIQQLQTDLAAAAADLNAAKQIVTKAAQQLDSVLASADFYIDGLLRPVSGGNIDQLRQKIMVLRNGISGAATAATGHLNPGGSVAQAQADLAGLAQNCTDAKNALTGTPASPGLIGNLQTAATNFTGTTIEKTLASINTFLMKPGTDWISFTTAASQQLTAISTNLNNTVDSHLTDLQNQMTGYAGLACQQILQTNLQDVFNSVTQLLDPAAIGQFFDNWENESTAAISQAMEDYLHSLESSAGQFLNAVRPQLTLPSLPAGIADASLFLLRGFGDVPKVPQLDFKLQFTAFRFAGLDPNSLLPFQLPQVNLTPLVGLANQLGASIGNPINLQVPTFQLADSLLPFSLSSFDFGSILPHIAGMDLSNLFQGMTFPDDPLGENVVVTHGEDPASQSAWVKIVMNVDLADDVEVFSYFGVTVTLQKANFQALADFQGQVGKSVTSTVSGAVRGSWSVAAGGFDIVVFEDCTLTFDQSGHFGFDITPAKMKLQSVLEFLSDLIASFFSGDGFTTSVTAEGVQTLLDLPLPDVQSGTFGIANLRLMSSFGLVFEPSFQIKVGLALASADNPFTLTVFILGGAGYVSVDAAYTPSENRISTQLDIGIFASASLAISLGPISGGVYAYFGITVSYHAETGSAPDLQIALVLMFIGEVSLLGFISVSLMLCLSAAYDSTSHVLIGQGTVSYSIKISFFFTINVSTSVSYTFSNHPVAVGPAPYDTAAAEYVGMFVN